MIQFVKDSGGLDYAVKQMKIYQERAFSMLENYPASPYKSSLEIMMNYVIDRKK